jgi:hypothetical protein
MNLIGVPSCHDYSTEWYYWRQYVEAKHSINDPRILALVLPGCTHLPRPRATIIMVTEKMKPPTAMAGPAKR